MATISLCMIVKNESHCLRRCLDSVKTLVDEIVIVDTGSTDNTRKIAREYTDYLYEFAWTGSFSDARNFAFSKCTMEYIYSADADEELDQTNQMRFATLKENLVPEIEIVQMYYTNQLEFGTVYNFDKELRPKLFKRLREFKWIEPIHETVRLDPVVYDSDIEIIHRPANLHSDRDLVCFERLIANDEALSSRLLDFYLRELFVSGTVEHFAIATDYLVKCIEQETDADRLLAELTVVAKAFLEQDDTEEFFKYTMKAVALGSCSEICCLLGEYYFRKKDFAESYMWFYNGAHETECILNIKYKNEIPQEGMEACKIAQEE